MAALRFELISSERAAVAGGTEVAGNQYSSGVNTAGYYDPMDQLNNPPSYCRYFGAREMGEPLGAVDFAC